MSKKNGKSRQSNETAVKQNKNADLAAKSAQDDKQVDLAKLVKEASEKHGTAKSKGKATYSVQSLDKRNRSDMRAANMEIGTYDELCRRFDNSILSYKEWAKQDVVYTDSNQSVKENLRACNDGYTMSTIMDMLSPLQQGITFSALAQIWMQSKIIQHMDPDFNMNVSRLTEHLRQDILAKKKSSLATRTLLKGVDERLLGISANNLEVEINRSVKDATIDDLVMTPRQIAAIKLNFAEQCYRDMRTVQTRGEMVNLRNQYDTAVEHLAAIAKNSGFDMSVVAAEERYLVGLKMENNPGYGKVFYETYDLKAHPVRNGERWTGDFMTYDGKPYTTGNSVSTGAFTPRMPHVIYDSTHLDDAGKSVPNHSQAQLEQMFRNRAELFALAMHYLDDPACEFNDKMRNQIKKSLEQQIDRYKKDSIDWMKDDGLSVNWKENFQKAYDDMFNDLSGGVSRANNMYDSFVDEMKHNSNKKIIEDVLGETVPSIREAEYAALSDDDKKEPRLRWYAQVMGQVDRVADALHSEDEGPGYKKREVRSDTRSGEEIINDARKDQLSNCGVQQATDLLMQSVVNLYQGEQSRKSLERNGSLCFESKRYLEGSAEVREVLHPRAASVRGTEFDDLFKDVTVDEVSIAHP